MANKTHVRFGDFLEAEWVILIMKKYLVVLDFEVGIVKVHTLLDEAIKNYEFDSASFISDIGYPLDNVQYGLFDSKPTMVTDEGKIVK